VEVEASLIRITVSTVFPLTSAAPASTIFPSGWTAAPLAPPLVPIGATALPELPKV